MPRFAGKERAEESCAGRTFSSHPSRRFPPSPGAARRPENPETPCAIPAPGADRPRSAPACCRHPPLLRGAAEPVAMSFGDRRRLFCLHRGLTPSGVRAVGKNGVSVSVCPCVRTAPQVRGAVRPSPERGHRMYGGLPLPGGCRIWHRDGVFRKAPCPPSRGPTKPPPPSAGWPWSGTSALDPTSFVFTLYSGQKVRNLLVGFFFFTRLDKLKDPK